MQLLLFELRAMCIAGGCYTTMDLSSRNACYSDRIARLIPKCRRWYRCNVDLSGFVPPPPPPPPLPGSGNAALGSSGGGIACIPDAAGMSPEEFEALFDGPSQPALLGGLAADWAGGLLGLVWMNL